MRASGVTATDAGRKLCVGVANSAVALRYTKYEKADARARARRETVSASRGHQNKNEILMHAQISAFPRAFRAEVLALCAALVFTCSATAKPAPPGFGGLVSIADGDPYTLIRGTSLATGTKGVTLAAGDMVETGKGAFVVVELQGGSLLGIGPSTQLYLMQRTAADTPTVVVLRGWVKADIRSGAKAAPIRIIGTRLGVQSHQAVVLLYADERSDSIFDEQGSATLLQRDDAATRTAREVGPNQFFIREEHTDVIAQPRPSRDFISAMPLPFHDPLPEHASAKLKKMATPQVVREVSYSDVQHWLTMPRDWRAGFIPRFRPRIKDPAFFAAMDATMSQHPEWQIILHPPPPPDEDQHTPARTASSPPH